MAKGVANPHYVPDLQYHLAPAIELRSSLEHMQKSGIQPRRAAGLSIRASPPAWMDGGLQRVCETVDAPTQGRLYLYYRDTTPANARKRLFPCFATIAAQRYTSFFFSANDDGVDHSTTHFYASRQSLRRSISATQR